MFDQPLSFLSGQSRFCGTRFIVRWAGGMQLKNALETGIQARFKGIEKRTPEGPFIRYSPFFLFHIGYRCTSSREFHPHRVQTLQGHPKTVPHL